MLEIIPCSGIGFVPSHESVLNHVIPDLIIGYGFRLFLLGQAQR